MSISIPMLPAMISPMVHLCRIITGTFQAPCFLPDISSGQHPETWTRTIRLLPVRWVRHFQRSSPSPIFLSTLVPAQITTLPRICLLSWIVELLLIVDGFSVIVGLAFFIISYPPGQILFLIYSPHLMGGSSICGNTTLTLFLTRLPLIV